MAAGGASPSGRSAIADLLAEAINLPAEGSDEAFSGADHDAAIYGQP